METDKRIRPPLIVDPDKDFLDQLRDKGQFSSIVPDFAQSVREAQILLTNENKRYAGIFVNPKISNPGGITVIRYARMSKPTTPIYLICDDKCIYDDQELKGLGIQKLLQKPLNYQQIVSLIAPSVLFFDAKTVIKSAKLTEEHALNTEIRIEDSKLKPIRANDFLSGTICFFDVYVQIGVGRYIKILQAGEKLSADRLMRYLKRGLEYFYIKKEIQEHYLSYCDHLSTSLLKRADVPIELKISQILNHGEETIKFLRNQGLNDSNIKYSIEFLGKLQALVKKLNPEKQPMLRKFMENVTTYDHGVAVATIASFLIPSMTYPSTSPVETIGIAALFHDIGLVKLGIKNEDTQKMSKEELVKYYSHPEVGAQVLSLIPGIKSPVIQSVQQHHERRTKKGFPFQIGPGSISIMAEIIGISDEFFRILDKTNHNADLNLQKELETHVYPHFSPKLVAEFKKAFPFTTLSNEVTSK